MPGGGVCAVAERPGRWARPLGRARAERRVLRPWGVRGHLQSWPARHRGRVPALPRRSSFGGARLFYKGGEMGSTLGGGGGRWARGRYTSGPLAAPGGAQPGAAEKSGGVPLR